MLMMFITFVPIKYLSFSFFFSILAFSLHSHYPRLLPVNTTVNFHREETATLKCAIDHLGRKTVSKIFVALIRIPKQFKNLNDLSMYLKLV